MNSYLEIFDPSKLMQYGNDATLALARDPKRLAKVKAMLQKQPEGFIGYMYAFALDHKTEEFRFKILGDPQKASPEMITEYQRQTEDVAGAYYQAATMPGHLIDT